MSPDWPLFHARLAALGDAVAFISVCLAAASALIVGAFCLAFGITLGHLRLGLLGGVLISAFVLFLMLFVRPT